MLERHQQYLPLTTAIDTASAATFNGIAGVAGGASTTLNTGDTLTGSTGTVNTLSLIGLGTAVAPGAIATTSNIPTINYRGVGANGAAVDNINQLLMAGVTAVNSNLSISDLTVVNGVLATTYAIKNAVSTGAGAANNADLSITYAAPELAGSADTAKFSVNNAGVINTAETAFSTFTIGNAATGVATTALERVQVTTAGSNNIALNLNSDITRINGAGSGTNLITIAANNATSLIDFGASTGTNTYVVGAGLSTNDSVTGGTGSDTVRATLAGVAGGLVFTGVETFTVIAGSAGTAGFTTATGLTTVENGSGNNVNTFTGLSALTTLRLVGAGTAAAQNAGTTTLTTALSGSADTLAINISNADTAATGYSSTVNVSGAETINVTTTDATVGVINTLTLRSATATTVTGTTTLKLVSPGGVTLNAYGATTTTAGGSLRSLDASGVAGVFNSGNLVASSFVSGASILLGAGGSAGAGNVLNVGAEAATDSISITGGSWIDTVAVGAGIFTANLGDGADAFNGRSATSFVAYGQAGNDVITSSLGLDVIIGGTGADTAVFNLGATAVPQVSTVATPTTAWSAGTLSVTIGGVTHTQAFATDIATSIDQFVAAYAGNILASTGVTVTDGTSNITFTGPASGASFTAPTAVITGTGVPVVALGTAAVLGSTSASNLNTLDLLTYVNADGDIIDLVTAAGAAVTMQVQQAAASTTVAGISATGLVSFASLTTQPTTLTAATNLVNAAIVAGTATAGDSAVFVFSGQAYLFIDDGSTTATATTSDVLVQLTGITSLSNGMTFSAGNDIISIS